MNRNTLYTKQVIATLAFALVSPIDLTTSPGFAGFEFLMLTACAVSRLTGAYAPMSHYSETGRIESP